MKWLKIGISVFIVLAVMRLGSWAIGWILSKLSPIRPKVVPVAANLVAFALFVFVLFRDLMPGEPMDLGAVAFGFVVYALYGWIDSYWRPWKSKAR